MRDVRRASGLVQTPLRSEREFLRGGFLRRLLRREIARRFRRRVRRGENLGRQCLLRVARRRLGVPVTRVADGARRARFRLPGDFNPLCAAGFGFGAFLAVFLGVGLTFCTGR